MIRTTAAISLALLMVASAALAGGPDDKHKKKGKPGKPAAKVVQVMTCPIMNVPSKKTAPTRTVSIKGTTYMVHFCCGKCPGAFDKLSAADKEKKIQDALKKKAEAAPAPKTASLIEVNTCPIQGKSSAGAPGGSSVVGNYKVNFCCGGCKPAFDALSLADKEAKIKSILKKS